MKSQTTEISSRCFLIGNLRSGDYSWLQEHFWVDVSER